MAMHKYAVFIMSHGRADRVYTHELLRRCGYTGKIYIVIDNEDEQADMYISKYGKDNVLIFDKAEEEQKMDTGDITGSRKCVVFARNKCYDLAKQHNYDYFIEADDDYVEFEYRHEKSGKLLLTDIRGNINKIFEAMFEFLDNTNAKAVAFCQGGDYIGGAQSGVWKSKLIRKCMNLFFCKTNNPINFIGRINEDVTSYTYYGSRGELMFSVADVCLEQKQTQSQSGGMSETYLENGTYLKSFYSVMWCPSAVKLAAMGSPIYGHKGQYRLHHNVLWNNCVPKIINDRYKK